MVMIIIELRTIERNSAYRSAIRIDGNAPGYDKKPLEAKKTGLKEKLINSEKSEVHRKQLAKLGYGNITFEKIDADDGKWTDGIDDPLSFGRKQN